MSNPEQPGGPSPPGLLYPLLPDVSASATEALGGPQSGSFNASASGALHRRALLRRP